MLEGYHCNLRRLEVFGSETVCGRKPQSSPMDGFTACRRDKYLKPEDKFKPAR